MKVLGLFLTAAGVYVLYQVLWKGAGPQQLVQNFMGIFNKNFKVPSTLQPGENPNGTDEGGSTWTSTQGSSVASLV